MQKFADMYQRKTFYSLFVYGILSEPLLTLYAYIPFLLRKDLDATSFQIALLTTLKPLVSLISFYWSVNICESKLKSNVVYASLLSRVPFLLFPFISNNWFLIASSACYMLFSRASTPAWMEILKRNLPPEQRGKVFSWSFSLNYLEGMLLSLGVGALLDKNPDLWKGLFFVSAVLGIFSILSVSRMPIRSSVTVFAKPAKSSLKEVLCAPWKSAYILMQTRPDFALFQWGFMLCGAGIMLVYPLIPLVLVDSLQFTHMEYSIALNTCKGLCIVLSSPLWGKFLHKGSLFTTSSWVFALSGIFLGCLVLGLVGHSPMWIYLGYCFYGIAQGGSHLLWSLSGTYFCKEGDSSLYSGVNVVMVGVRGAIAPFLGALLVGVFPPFFILILGGGLCFVATFFILKKQQQISFLSFFQK